MDVVTPEVATLGGLLAEIGITAFLWFAYYRASLALQESRKHAERRERRLLKLLWHMCSDSDLEMDEMD